MAATGQAPPPPAALPPPDAHNWRRSQVRTALCDLRLFLGPRIVAWAASPQVERKLEFKGAVGGVRPFVGAEDLEMVKAKNETKCKDSARIWHASLPVGHLAGCLRSTARLSTCMQALQLAA